MEVREVPIGKLKPAAYNPRVDLAPGDREYETLKASIERWDLVEPLVWNERTGNLVSGHQRLKICKKRGDRTVPVVVVDLPDTKERILNLALNRISGSWDYERLSEVLKEYSYADLGITGLTEAEIDRLTKAANDAVQATVGQIDSVVAGRSVPAPAPAQTPAPASAPAEPVPYLVYLSFPDRAGAEEWLEANGHGDAQFRKGERIVTLAVEDGE